MDKLIIDEEIWNTYNELRRQGKIEDWVYENGLVYVGLPGKDKTGKIYECYEDFFLRKEGEEKSDFECLIEEIQKGNQ